MWVNIPSLSRNLSKNHFFLDLEIITKMCNFDKSVLIDTFILGTIKYNIYCIFCIQIYVKLHAFLTNIPR